MIREVNIGQMFLTMFVVMTMASGCQTQARSQDRSKRTTSDATTTRPNAPSSLAPADEFDVYNPFAVIKWTAVKDYGNVRDNGSAYFRDVVGHTDPDNANAPRGKGMSFSPDSVAIHETGHMLHNQLRQIERTFDGSKESVYHEDGNGFVFTRPNLKISEYSASIPEVLRPAGSPYKLYVIDQPTRFPSHDNMAYLFNEWGAYNMSIRMLLELEEAGRPEPDSLGHAMNSAPYFFGYVAYGMHALYNKDPAATQEPQFKAAFAICAQTTWELMQRTLKSPVFGTDDTVFGPSVPKMMEFYRHASEFEPVRKSLAAIYGQAWVDKTFMRE